MTRSKKPTINQLNQRIEQLENAVGELQQFVSLIYHSSKNDLLRHEGMMKELCEKADVEFTEHENPTENIEESQGGSE